MVLVTVEWGSNTDEVNETSFSFNIKQVNLPALETKLEQWSEELG
jgi:hypothetical protein